MSKAKPKYIWDDTADEPAADYPVIDTPASVDVAALIPARPANAKDARVIASHAGSDVRMIIDKAAGQKRYYVQAGTDWLHVATYDTARGEWA
jgi:hypothetical protein